MSRYLLYTTYLLYLSISLSFMPQIRSGGLFAICLAEGRDGGGPREQGHWEQPGIEAILSHCRNQTLNIVVY